MWMQEALNHLNEENNNNTSVNKVDILDHLAYATSQVSFVIDNSQVYLFENIPG